MYEVLYVPGTWWRRLGGAWKRTKLILCFWTYFSKRVVWTSYVSYQVPAQAPRVHFFCRVKCFCKMCSTYSYINRPPYKSVHVWSCFFFFCNIELWHPFFFLTVYLVCNETEHETVVFSSSPRETQVVVGGRTLFTFSAGPVFFLAFFFFVIVFFCFCFPSLEPLQKRFFRDGPQVSRLRDRKSIPFFMMI